MKNMTLNIVAAALLLCAVTGCRSKSAFNYSQSIVKIERSMEADIVSAEEKISDFLTREVYDSALVVTQRMENLVDSKSKELQALKTPDAKEADNFRRAAIRYFDFIKSVYTAYKDYILQASPEDREAARVRLLDLVNEKDKAIGDMQTAQKKFAQANGFRIEK